MYNLQPIKDCKHPLVQAFYDDLPKKPYCSDEKNYLRIRPKETAKKHRYIQPNSSFLTTWLVLDIDRKGYMEYVFLDGQKYAVFNPANPQPFYNDAIFAYYDHNLPPPQLITQNPASLNVHYLYKLTTPISFYENSHSRPQNYLASVLVAMTKALQADPHYTGLITQNPLNPNWRLFTASNQDSYTLEELSENLELKLIPFGKRQDSKTNQELSHTLWRNCTLFDEVRVYAYPIADQCDYGGLERRLDEYAHSINNQFNNSLSEREVRHIVRSITRFCKSAKFRDYSTSSTEKFRQTQAVRATIGNEKHGNATKGGQARSTLFLDKREQAIELHRQGLNNRQISDILGLRRETISRWINQFQKLQKHA